MDNAACISRAQHKLLTELLRQLRYQPRRLGQSPGDAHHSDWTETELFASNQETASAPDAHITVGLLIATDGSLRRKLRDATSTTVDAARRMGEIVNFV